MAELREMYCKKEKEATDLNYNLNDMTVMRQTLQAECDRLKEREISAQDRIHKLGLKTADEIAQLKERIEILQDDKRTLKNKIAELETKLEDKKIELKNATFFRESVEGSARADRDALRMAEGETRGALKAMKVFVENLRFVSET